MKKHKPDYQHLGQVKIPKQQVFSPFPSPKEDDRGKQGASPPDSSFESHHQSIFIKEEYKDIKNLESPKKTINLKNPFMKFYNDSNSKPLIPSPQGFKIDLDKKMIDLTPHKESPKENQKNLDNWYQEIYLKLNHKLVRKPIQSYNFYFFRQSSYPQLTFSKLLWFTPNRKNGRHLIYNMELHKCISVYRCEGCLKDFNVPSALGGHLSSCLFKQIHSQVLQQQKSNNFPQIFKDGVAQKRELRSNAHSQRKMKISDNEIYFDSKSSQRSKTKNIKKKTSRHRFRTLQTVKTSKFHLKVRRKM